MKSRTRAGVIESLWKETLQNADKSRLRKARQDARNGSVSNIRLHEDGITASVKASGPERGTFQVFLPLLADYRAHLNQIAKWLARRPDWLGAHFAEEWETPFLTFLKENDIHVFPDGEADWERIEQHSKCTCTDWHSVCAHALALLVQLITEADEHPLSIFRFVGVEVDDLLDKTHVESHEMYVAAHSSDSPITVDDTHSVNENVLNLLRELDLESIEPKGRLVPQFHMESLAKLR